MTKEERNYVLQKLQTFCKQVFVTNGAQGAAEEHEDALLASADGSRLSNEKEAGTPAALKFQPKHHSTPSPKKVGKIDNNKESQSK